MNTTAGVIGLIMGFLGVFTGWYILILIARWKVFSKAGIDGWKCLIPFYSDYCTFKIAWRTKYFWWHLGVGFLSAICSGRIEDINERGGEVPALLTLASFIAGAALMVLNIMLNVKLAEKFGQSVLFGVGLFLLTPVFTLILGLGSADYLGNPEEGLPARHSYFR